MPTREKPLIITLILLLAVSAASLLQARSDRKAWLLAEYEEDVITAPAPTAKTEYEQEVITAPAKQKIEYEQEVLTVPSPKTEYEQEIKTAPAPKPKPKPVPKTEYEDEIKTAVAEENLRPSARPEQTEYEQEVITVPGEPGAEYEDEVITSVQTAEQALRTRPTRPENPAPIRPPESVAAVKTALDVCREKFSGLDFISHADSDGDGLSDETECYGGSRPDKSDSDGDGCADGAEINTLGTDPKNRNDCGKKEAPEEQQVIIADPQPGWTVQSAQASGVVPEETASVTLIAFAEEHAVVRDLAADVAAIGETVTPEEAQAVIARMEKGSVEAAKNFLQEQNDTEYAELKSVVETMTATLAAAGVSISMSKEAVLTLRDDISVAKADLDALLRDTKIILGSTEALQTTELSGKSARYFSIAGTALPGGKAYDLVTIATLLNGETVASDPTRFYMDESAYVPSPRPFAISDVPITEKPGAFRFPWFGDALAASENGGTELTIKDARPVILGDTEFGTRVFAIWESVVLASSVIADSELGSFSIQAPREMETDVGHRITLYAVKEKTDGTGLARSESVNVFFRIKPENPLTIFIPYALAGLAAAGGGLWLIRVLRRRSNR